MTSVAFPFGSKPVMLRERQALEVAGALGTKRNLAAQSAAQKIRDQARVNLDAGETRKAVDFIPEEVAELAVVMNEAAWPDEPDYARLRRQVNRA